MDKSVYEHCYRVRLTVEIPKTYEFEGYICVPLEYEEDTEYYLATGCGFDWEFLRKDCDPMSPNELLGNLDILPFDYEILYDTNADELEE